MIIDLILDRYDGFTYNPHDFYIDVLSYGDMGEDITRAMDYGTEADVKKALKLYVIENEYNLKICDYIDSVHWLDDDNTASTVDIFEGLPKNIEEYNKLKVEYLKNL